MKPAPMTGIYRLHNTVKHYAWGSPAYIPRLLGKDNPSGVPWAELWMGVHPEGPSAVESGGKLVPLSQLTELPFLLKFLAAARPLSIQAHPDQAQAQEGFERENRAGIPLSAPERNYKDPGHKPEIVSALTPFTALAGFRERAETEELLVLLEQGCAENGGAGLPPGKLRRALSGGCREFLSVLFALGKEEQNVLTGAALRAGRYYAESKAGPEAKPSGQEAGKQPGCRDANFGRALELCGELAAAYPGDPGILSPLYLNVIELKPGEAIFVPAGILHAYVRGFALECMANSDNVLRGGLTPKHVDWQELFRVLRFDSFKPEILVPEPLNSAGTFVSDQSPAAPCVYRYKTPVREFVLYMVKSSGGNRGPAELDAPGDTVLAVHEGQVSVSITGNGNAGNAGNANSAVRLGPGESAFVQRCCAGEKIALTGDGALFAAVAPET